jgi:hypothetical protein
MRNESVKKVFLVIADISGYTQFMVSSDIEVEHSQYIISQLIESIIQQIKIPLQIRNLKVMQYFYRLPKIMTNIPVQRPEKKLEGNYSGFFQHSMTD